MTLLMYSIFQDVKFIEFLLQNNADVNYSDEVNNYNYKLNQIIKIIQV